MLNIIITSLIDGITYALLAIGFSLIFGIDASGISRTPPFASWLHIVSIL